MTEILESCYWCHQNCGGTCLGLSRSTQMRADDPAYHLLVDGVTSTPVVYEAGCYICEDPEFAQMGLPLCKPCDLCRSNGRGEGHVPADDEECSVCGHNAREAYYRRVGRVSSRGDVLSGIRARELMAKWSTIRLSPTDHDW